VSSLARFFSFCYLGGAIYALFTNQPVLLGVCLMCWMLFDNTADVQQLKQDLKDLKIEKNVKDIKER